ncbi:hypothetical protein P0082_01850 [Candidatus Haliotispira prima]|uniref:Outer membrane protein beta-barrel domain-containing protein n=1 Tax=Candidatus Haliotispira prima TaxID=3034016 RepID=A0ABY8MK98_9SPIO|nr:hypothetical protein P0082_01850 [Candidatus Haliotispira prima]
MSRHRISLQNLLLLFLLLCPAGVLSAQNPGDDEQDTLPGEDIRTVGGRYQGDVGLQINGYLWAPLFNIDPNAGSIKETGLGVGGGADFAVAYYLTANFGIGGFLDLGISSPVDQTNIRNYFLSVLVGPRISYDINVYTSKFTSHPLFSFPLGFGVAISATKFGDITNIIPVVKFDAGIYVNPFNQPEWSFGVSLHYWFAPEFTSTELSRIGNYLMIGIGVSLHSGL